MLHLNMILSSRGIDDGTTLSSSSVLSEITQDQTVSSPAASHTVRRHKMQSVHLVPCSVWGFLTRVLMNLLLVSHKDHTFFYFMKVDLL